MALRYLAGAVVLVAAAAIFGWWQSRYAGRDPVDVLPLLHDPGCDLRAGPCALGLPGGGRATLSIRPRALPPMVPLALEVAVEGSPLVALWVDFTGIDMNMGFNRVSMTSVGEGRFSATGIIPVCISERMIWEAQVMLSDGDRWIRAPFRFEVLRNGARP